MPALVLLLSCPAFSWAALLRVAVVLSASGGSYQEFADSFKQALSTNHSVQIANMGEVLQPFDLMVAVGMRASAERPPSSGPVLSVLVPRTGFDSLQRADTDAISAIYMDQPIQRQLALLSAVLPGYKHLGILYAQSSEEIARVRRASEVRQLVLHERKVDAQHELGGVLAELLEDSQVLLAIPDAEIYRSDTIRNILLETYRAKVPVIGISPAYVRAGALCAIFSTPKQIASQAAEAIEQFSQTGRLPASQYAREFEVAVNVQVPRSLGLPIKDAEQLRIEVGRRQ